MGMLRGYEIRFTQPFPGPKEIVEPGQDLWFLS
jgi:hypothetical protein